MSKALNIVITTVTAFTTGVVVGLLLTPQSGKENRKWISDHSSEAKNWMEEKGHQFLEKSEERLEKISDGIKGSLPDLYEATEGLKMEEEDLEDA
ncbi:MAG: YtxH domain-containing protein [Balneolales bacterium]|nr:YtxH domain-containing protein [Balneolales bacterium]